MDNLVLVPEHCYDWSVHQWQLLNKLLALLVVFVVVVEGTLEGDGGVGRLVVMMLAVSTGML